VENERFQSSNLFAGLYEIAQQVPSEEHSKYFGGGDRPG
jgi:hypothetical protein